MEILKRFKNHSNSEYVEKPTPEEHQHEVIIMPQDKLLKHHIKRHRDQEKQIAREVEEALGKEKPPEPDTFDIP